jgi:hypothetical protein
MEPIDLTTDETLALLELIDAGLASSPETHSSYDFLPGGLYPVTWELGSLDTSGIERAAWLLGQLGFSVSTIVTRSIPSDIGGVANELYTVSATRTLPFHRYALLGEALIVESVAAPWETHIDRFYLHSDGKSHHSALVSLHGPFGTQIM